jgi:hypothetical protein
MQAATAAYARTLYRSDGYGYRAREIIEAYKAADESAPSSGALEALKGFVEFVATLDDPIAIQRRQTISLTPLIERAKRALAAYNSTQDRPAESTLSQDAKTLKTMAAEVALVERAEAAEREVERLRETFVKPLANGASLEQSDYAGWLQWLKDLIDEARAALSTEEPT